METRARHILIGVFVITMMGALLGFVLWAAKIDIDREFTRYDIVFTESVTGLSVGSDVSYSGVNVGQVTKIALNANNPSQVRVTIKVAGGTPVKEDSVASLDYQGLTGVAYVQISGGTAAAALLQPGEGEERAIIRSIPSQLQKLFTGAPDLIKQSILLVGRLQKLFDDDNLQRVASILDHAERISASLDARSGDLGPLVDNVNATLAAVRSTAGAIDKVANTADGLLDDDVRALVADLQKTAGGLARLSENLETAVADNAAALGNFSANTLPEIGRFVRDARRMAASLARIAERIEQSPKDFIFSTDKPEYQPK